MWGRRLHRILVAAALGLFATASSATNFGHIGPFSELVIFSGSLSDTGNDAAVNGDYPAPFFNNRNSNGPVAVDILAAKFNLSSASSLHLVGKNAGTNYAVLHANAAGTRPIDLPAQLQAYLKTHPKADPKALYFIFIGANDIVEATIEQDEAKSEALLNAGINEVEKTIRKLHSIGARVFYAPNNVDIGTAPVAMQFGVSARATEKTEAFNLRWELLMRKLERQLNVTIYRFDFFRFVNDLFPITDKFGITNTTESCLALVPQGKCDLDRFAFINELLPTKKIHDLFGNALSIALIEQLSTPVCAIGHRCGRGDLDRAYSVIGMPSPWALSGN